MLIHFVDCETTGLPEHDANHEVIDCCIATWKYENGKAEVQLKYSQKFRPLGGVSAEVAKINGYTPEGYAGYPVFDAFAARDIYQALDGLQFWAGSNPSFDKDMLRRMFARARFPWLPRDKMSHRCIDLSSNGFPLLALGKIKGLGLSALGEYFGFGPTPHTAEGDVLAGIEIFQLLTKLAIEGFKVAP